MAHSLVLGQEHHAPRESAPRLSEVGRFSKVLLADGRRTGRRRVQRSHRHGTRCKHRSPSQTRRERSGRSAGRAHAGGAVGLQGGDSALRRAPFMVACAGRSRSLAYDGPARTPCVSQSLTKTHLRSQARTTASTGSSGATWSPSGMMPVPLRSQSPRRLLSALGCLEWRAWASYGPEGRTSRRRTSKRSARSSSSAALWRRHWRHQVVR